MGNKFLTLLKLKYLFFNLPWIKKKNSYNACIYSAMNIFIIADFFVMSMLLSASVFSVSLDPVNNSMAVTGGEDDKAYVWRIQDGETHMECIGRFW